MEIIRRNLGKACQGKGRKNPKYRVALHQAEFLAGMVCMHVSDKTRTGLKATRGVTA